MKPVALGMRLLALALVAACAGCSLQVETTPTPAPAATPTPSPVASPTVTPVATPTPEPPAAYKTYTDQVNGFSIEYPADWAAVAPPAAVLVVTSGEVCGGQQATFTLSKLESFTSGSVEAFFGSIISGTFLSSERSFVSGEKVGVAGRAAIKWVTTVDRPGGIPLLDTSYYLIGDTAGWVLSFTVIYSCRDQYQDAFDHMAGSFQFLP